METVFTTAVRYHFVLGLFIRIILLEVIAVAYIALLPQDLGAVVLQILGLGGGGNGWDGWVSGDSRAPTALQCIIGINAGTDEYFRWNCRLCNCIQCYLL